MRKPGRGATVSRRSAISMLAGTPLFAQGVASRGVTPTPRGKPSGKPFLSTFTDVAKQAGLHVPAVFGGRTSKTWLLETIGCGVAFIDYDNDGWLDIFVLNGTRFEDERGQGNRLYKNNRDGTFTDVTARAGLEWTGWACGVCVGDFNNDGFEDLFVTCWGQNVLYRNNGDGTFTDVTKASGLLDTRRRWGSGCTFIDYDRDGLLDLFVANYVDFDPARVPKSGGGSFCNWKGISVNCGPRGLPAGRPSLYRNNGDGTFTDVSESSGIGKATGKYGLTAVAADFDDDGWPDIFVACDSTPSLLFHNNHDGTFSEVGMESGVALNDDGMEQAGMGVAVGDYNLDGRLDIFKTHFSDDTNVLYRNTGRLRFEDVTIPAGFGVETRFTGWGAAMVDLDNDGEPDIFYVTGQVYPEVEPKLPAYPYRTSRVVFRNLGSGKFEELIEQAGPGVAARKSSRGCAFGDFDNDGDIDVLVLNFDEPPSLLRNDITGNHHWVKVKLIGVKSNRSAIGARVTATYGGKKQAQEVLSQASFVSVNDLRLHFGLGAATSVDLKVRWPNGQNDVFSRVSVDKLITIREGDGIVSVASLQRK
jgi:enediyne biosynthesis protein E4